MLERIAIEEAKQILLKQNLNIKLIDIPISEGLGYILAEDIISDINMPPFDRSPLDGYAVRSVDIVNASKENPIRLEVIDSIAAGYVSDKKVGKGQAIRIMTGAKIPQGADVIIMYEITDFTDEEVKIYNSFVANSNIVKAGEDIEFGDIILKKGKTLGVADIGILATLGKKNVKVYKKPRVGILATGDELVNIEEEIKNGKIRNSNSYTIAAAVEKLGGQAIMLGISRDDIDFIKEKLKDSIEDVDMIITTGGVSVGDADLVKEAFQELGGDILFWRVNMKPGTPIAVAKYKDKLLFGLSGNPAAAYMTFELFVRPIIKRLRGNKDYSLKKLSSILKNDFTKVSKQNRYVRGRTYYEDGQVFTELPSKHSSGVLSSLSNTNSLFFVKAGKGPYRSGDKVEIELLDLLEVR